LFLNSGIGINICDNQVDIVYLRGSFKGAELIAETSFTVSERSAKQDRIREIADFVNRFVKEQRISASDIHFGFSGERAIMREIEFPMAVKENLRSALLYEMEKYVPMDVDDIYFDYQIIAEDKAASKLKVLLVVIKKADLDFYIQVAEVVDKGVSGIEISPAAVLNFYLEHPEAGNDTFIVVYAAGDRSDLMVSRDQKLIYATSFHVPEQISDNEQMVCDHLKKLKDRFFENGQKVRLINYGVSMPAELTARLANDYDIVTPDLSDYGIRKPESVPAYGLAFQAIKNVAVQINLMPQQYRKKPDKTGYYVMYFFIGLLMLTLLLWAGSHLVHKRNLLNQLDIELTRLRGEVSHVERMYAELTEKKERLESLAALRPGNVYIVEILSELADRIPDTAWLKDFNLKKNKLTLSGSAESASELILLLEESSLFKDVEFLSAIRKGRDEKEVFRIGLSVTGKAGGE